MGTSCSSGIRKAIMGGGSHKVCVCGAAGGIGQPLCLLMAMEPNVKELAIFDVNVAMVPADGVAEDLGHIESKVKVTGYSLGVDQPPKVHLNKCLSGCSLVLVAAGMPRKPGMTRDHLFKVNADIAKGIVEACAKFCPQAVVALIVNPINSIVLAMAELYKKAGLDPKKIVGVTTLDCVRANKFVSDIVGCHPSNVEVPVIGGHDGITIMPVFSQEPMAARIDQSALEALDKKTQDAGTDVVNKKMAKDQRLCPWPMQLHVLEELCSPECRANLLSSVPMSSLRSLTCRILLLGLSLAEAVFLRFYTMEVLTTMRRDGWRRSRFS